ncbi:nitrate- and nitrite sensing domain-containing protein [Embleya hyalina]|uniref:histidine kinase n=1 Tax=Embleya hyalina TaxID=516124 RepID=A0A401Z0B1_9ACTN|nr:nitrate- and nitrite sensing domain-containing protein [Embleya hyalina]GCE00289.1 histidine kinase [Embleya hyalina]
MMRIRPSRKASAAETTADAPPDASPPTGTLFVSPPTIVDPGSRPALRIRFAARIRPRVRGLITLMVVVPSAGMVFFAGSAILDMVEQARAADHAHDLVRVSADAGEVGRRLQAESAAAVTLLSRGPGPITSADYRTAIDASETAIRRYQDRRRGLETVSTAERDALTAVDTALRGLPGLRLQVDQRGVATSAAAVRYWAWIGTTVDLRARVALDPGVSGETAGRLRAITALAQARAALGQQQVTVLRSLGADPLGGPVLKASSTARAAHDQALEAFAVTAPSRWRERLARSLSGPEMIRVAQTEDALTRGPLEPEVWRAALAERADRVWSVEQEADADVAREVADVADHRWWLAGIQGAVLIGAVLAAAAAAAWLGRLLHRRLRTLAERVTVMTQETLPAVEADLRRRDALAPHETGRTYALKMLGAKPERERGADEIADLARALTTLAYSTVEHSASLVLAQREYNDALGDVARRIRVQTSRVSSALDRLQESNLTVDQLGTVFEVDHGNEGTKRLADSIAVLSGQPPNRLWPDTPLYEVVRAGAQRVTSYERLPDIAFKGIPTSVTLAGDTVGAVTQIIGEIVDNAARFSGRHEVEITAARTEAGVLVRILDQGVGHHDPDLLNRRLKADVDALPSLRQTGLTVVALQARPLAIDVELRPGTDGGTVVDIVLPHAIIASVGRHRRRVDNGARPIAPRPASAAITAGANGNGNGPNGRSPFASGPNGHSPFADGPYPLTANGGGPADALGDGANGADPQPPGPIFGGPLPANLAPELTAQGLPRRARRTGQPTQFRRSAPPTRDIAQASAAAASFGRGARDLPFTRTPKESP